LIALLAAGLWRDQPERALRALMPWFEDPLIFLASLDQIQRESRSLDMFADDEPSAHLFRVLRGSRVPHAVELPWLDVEKAVLIAVNRNPGDDVAIALDYRTNPLDPRVVACDFWTNPRQCAWLLNGMSDRHLHRHGLEKPKDLVRTCNQRYYSPRASPRRRKNGCGSIAPDGPGSALTCTSKCRCGPVELPEEPT
jgi:hypothetical protein